MQNIKNVVEAIGTDIGNLSRHHNELETQLRALQQFIQDLQNAPAPDGSEAGETSPAPAEMVRLDYTHPFIQERTGHITVAIPEAYRGGIGFYFANGNLRLKGNLGASERFYAELQPNQPFSLTVIKPAKIENAGAADLSEMLEAEMQQYKLINYHQAGDQAAHFPGMPAGFIRATHGIGWNAERYITEPLPEGKAEAIPAAVEAVIAAQDEIRQQIENGDYLSMISGWGSLSDLGFNDYYSSRHDFEYALDGVRDLPIYLRDSYPAQFAAYREILKSRREEQHGALIRNLVAAGGVLVD